MQHPYFEVFTETTFLISGQWVLIACSTPSFMVNVEAGQLLQFPTHLTSTVSGSLMATNSTLPLWLCKPGQISSNAC